jgi:bifunctional NMN adenylyltransferase/nudix hydrolase
MPAAGDRGGARAVSGFESPATPAAYKYDLAVFIGRFRFLHKGHLSVMRRALVLSQHLVVLVGSCRQPRTLRNPLTFDEVRENILGALDAAVRRRVLVYPLVDLYDDARWSREVEAAVQGAIGSLGMEAGRARVALIGHAKDRSSYYLQMFPQWASEDVPGYDGLSATPIREAYFADAAAALAQWGPQLPANVAGFLCEFATTKAYEDVAAEAAYLREYRASWAAAPYPPTFVTADAVVIAKGHVLLVQRREHPGRGLLALPGGFIGERERIRAAMRRELEEETGLGGIDAFVQAVEVFDHPYRSARGRTITHAFLVVLPDESGLPEVKGGDDAVRAFWQPIAELEPEKMIDDHCMIIRTMVARVCASEGPTGGPRAGA